MNAGRENDFAVWEDFVSKTLADFHGKKCRNCYESKMLVFLQILNGFDVAKGKLHYEQKHVRTVIIK